jgi:hypothetical protein
MNQKHDRAARAKVDETTANAIRLAAFFYRSTRDPKKRPTLREVSSLNMRVHDLLIVMRQIADGSLAGDELARKALAQDAVYQAAEKEGS